MSGAASENKSLKKDATLFASSVALSKAEKFLTKLARCPSGVGTAAVGIAKLPLDLSLNIAATDGDLASAWRRTQAAIGISLMGGGGILAAMELGKFIDDYIPSTSEMNNFYHSLDPDTQDLLGGQPDLAMFYLVRAPFWLLARAGEGLWSVVDDPEGTVNSFQEATKSLYRTVKESWLPALSLSAHASEPMAELTRAELYECVQAHVSTISSKNAFNLAQCITYAACLEEALTDTLSYNPHSQRIQLSQALFNSLSAETLPDLPEALKTHLSSFTELLSEDTLPTTCNEAIQIIQAAKTAEAQEAQLQKLQDKIKAQTKLAKEFKTLARTPSSGAGAAPVIPHAEIRKLAERGYQLGVIGSQVATAALLLGGHKRTWQGVAAVSRGFMQFSQAASALSVAAEAGKVLQSIAAGMNGAVGLISIGMTLLGKGAKDPLEVVMEQMQELASMMREGFMQVFENQRQIHDAIVHGVIPRVDLGNRRIADLKTVFNKVMQESMTMGLIEKLKALQAYHHKEEHPIAEAEVGTHLNTLRTWFQDHAFLETMTGMSFKSSDIAALNQYFSAGTFDMRQVLPLVIKKLAEYYPQYVPADCFKKIPNLVIFDVAATAYINAIMYPERFPGDYRRTLSGIVNTSASAIDLCFDIIKNPDLWKDLYADYHRLRRIVGHQIYLIINNGDLHSQAPETPLGTLLREGERKKNLMKTLEEMTLHKHFLEQLMALSGIQLDAMSNFLRALDTKDTILNTPFSIYRSEHDTACANAHAPLDTRFYRCLEMGANRNQAPSWGNMVSWAIIGAKPGHYRIPTQSVNRVERLLEFGVSIAHRATHHGCYGRATPIKYALATGQFEVAILMVASGKGFSFPRNRNSFHDRLRSSNLSSKLLVKVMDDIYFNSADKSLLHKDRLRKAYQYYRLKADRQHAAAEKILAGGIDFNCLLWLTALLGRWHVFEAAASSLGLPDDFDYDTSIQRDGADKVKTGLSPFILAVRMGRKDVVAALFDKPINKDRKAAYAADVNADVDADGNTDIDSLSKLLNAIDIAMLHFEKTTEHKVYGIIETAKFLIESGHYPDIPDATRRQVADAYSRLKPPLSFDGLVSLSLKQMRRNTTFAATMLRPIGTMAEVSRRLLYIESHAELLKRKQDLVKSKSQLANLLKTLLPSVQKGIMSREDVRALQDKIAEVDEQLQAIDDAVKPDFHDGIPTSRQAAPSGPNTRPPTASAFRTSNTASKQSTANRYLQTQATRFGLTVKEVEGDGNCFFHALVDQLKTRYNEDTTHAALRDETVCYLVEHATDFSDFVARKKDQPIDDYVNQMFTDRKWVDHPIVLAAARKLGITIVIIPSKDEKISIVNPDGDRCAILGYYTGVHYASLHGTPNEAFEASLEEASLPEGGGGAAFPS